MFQICRIRTLLSFAWSRLVSLSGNNHFSSFYLFFLFKLETRLIFTFKVSLCPLELHQTRATVDPESKEDHHCPSPCETSLMFMMLDLRHLHLDIIDMTSVNGSDLVSSLSFSTSLQNDNAKGEPTKDSSQSRESSASRFQSYSSPILFLFWLF